MHCLNVLYRSDEKLQDGVLQLNDRKGYQGISPLRYVLRIDYFYNAINFAEKYRNTRFEDLAQQSRYLYE